MRLFDFSWSGNCHKIKMFASIISLKIEIVPIDLLKVEHLRPPLQDLNPFCELPVFEDGPMVLRDSAAILVYLARRYGGETWFPTDPEEMARICQWFGTAAANVNFGPALARGARHFGYPADNAMVTRVSDRLFLALEKHLSSREWLELGRPTLADIAMFPYVASAPDGGLSLEPFEATRRWIGRVESLPGYIAMPSVLAA